MISDHGEAVEADLAFRGIDLRDLFRPGSGLTLRRLLVLIRALPSDSVLWTAQRAADEQAQKALTSVDRLRERQAHYDRQREAVNG